MLIPGLSAYRPEDVETAASRYCLEAIRAGITTFVDNQESSAGRWDHGCPDTSIDVYDRFGLRVGYARMFYDARPTGFDECLAAIEAKGPSSRLRYDMFETVEEAMGRIEDPMRRHNGRGNGRIKV